MKTQTKLSSLLFLSLFLIIIFSCKKNNDTSVEPLPIINNGYEIGEAGVIMTLAAIAYVAEGEEPAVIKDSILPILCSGTITGLWFSTSMIIT